MIRQSIRRQIVSIAVGLIVLMVITSIMSIVMARHVAHQLDDLTTGYFQAYGALARMNIRSFDRALELRRMVIAKMQVPPDEADYAGHLRAFEAKAAEVEREAQTARDIINAIIADTSTESDRVALGRIDSRITSANEDLRRYLTQNIAELLPLLANPNAPEVKSLLARIDTLRDDFNERIESARTDMMAQVRADAALTMRDQQRTIIVSAIVTGLAAIVGLIFAVLVSTGITRPVHRLLEGTREVEAGRLDGTIDVTTKDEIGQLSAAFNRMVGQLRQNVRVRETFGRYIDPRVVEGLIDKPAVTAAEGQRRIMTVMFCDMKGFTALSEGMTPQGLVKIMNRYLSTMSEPIRVHRGIIDKYIGDAIMAYWGPPFVEEGEQAQLACLAAIDMTNRLASLRKELPELIGVRAIPVECDLRIGIATGEALVGSIGSEFMMSYTVMGDTVNLASRLEQANKYYGCRSLVTGATIAAAGSAIEAREIDRLVVTGQTVSQPVFKIMGRKGEVAHEQLRLRDHYARGLAAYRARKWDEAASAFNAALEAVPGDGPARTMLERVAVFQHSPPAENWDGSWHVEKV
jgi:class 3 adenylate cyclase